MIKKLKKMNKTLIIIVSVLIVMLIGMTVFAFSEFDVSIETKTENKTEYDIQQDAETQGDNSGISQSNDLSTNAESNNTAFICGTVILCIGIITTGVVIYGKRKNTHTHNNFNKKDEKIDD